MKRTILYFTLILCIFSCKKGNYNDLSGQGTLKGIVILVDNLNGNSTYSKAPNITVYLKYAADGTGFLSSTIANTQGQYSFSGIDTTVSYKVYSSTDTGSVKLYGELPYIANTYNADKSDTLKLVPSQTAQNGIHLIVKDAGGTGTFPFVTAWVFTNYDQFMSDTSIGKAFDMTTNSFGISNKLNIAEGTYYLRIKTILGNRFLRGETTIAVGETGIQDAPINLSPYSPIINGFEAMILDHDSAQITNANVYVYKSLYFLNLDINNNSSDTLLKSNSLGIAARYNVDPAQYYLKVIKQVGSVILEKRDSIVVPANFIAAKKIVFD